MLNLTEIIQILRFIQDDDLLKLAKVNINYLQIIENPDISILLYRNIKRNSNIIMEDNNIIHPAYGYNIMNKFDFNNKTFTIYNKPTLRDYYYYFIMNNTNLKPLNITKFPKILENSIVSNVLIPDFITKIETGTFKKVKGLNYISIPSNVSILDIYAFDTCKSLKTLILPNNLIALPWGMCRNCYKLQSISLPSNLKKIPEFCFSKCVSLENIKIPNSVTEIGESAFSHCTNLTRINFNVVNLDYGCFEFCKNLEEINGKILKVEEYAFYYCKGFRFKFLDIDKFNKFAFAKYGNENEELIFENCKIDYEYTFNECRSKLIFKNCHFKYMFRELFNKSILINCEIGMDIMIN